VAYALPLAVTTNIIYAAVERLAVFCRHPNGAAVYGQIESRMAPCSSGTPEERPLFGERQPVMAATRGMIQHGGRFAIHFDSVLETQPT